MNDRLWCFWAQPSRPACGRNRPFAGTTDPDLVTCSRCKRKRAYKKALNKQTRQRAAGGPCVHANCNKTGAWQRVGCELHGQSMQGFVCSDHPLVFDCSSCAWEADAPKRAEVEAREARRKDEELESFRRSVSEFVQAGYTQEEAEALATKRAKDEQTDRERRAREAYVNETNRMFEEGTFGQCPRCGRNQKAVDGVVLAHNRPSESREYPWQEPYPETPCDGIGEMALPPRI